MLGSEVQTPPWLLGARKQGKHNQSTGKTCCPMKREGWIGDFEGILKTSTHRVPSATHVSKSQHGGKVPTCEPQVIIEIWLIIIKIGS